MPNLRGKTWTTTTPAYVEDAQYWEDHLISDADAAKITTSVQSVNNTTPDAQGNVDIVALPSGGTAGQVLTKQSSTEGDADWEDPASSGHTIVDEDDTDMPYRTNLQFLNAEVTDDSVNDTTVVDCKGAKGDAATVAVGTTTTLAAGSDATVTNSGTSSAAVFNFGIPKGADGADGADGSDGADGVSVTGVTLYSTSGRVKTYRMTFSDGTHFDYEVTDGENGSGAGDMLQSDYDPNQTVYNAGGIPDYVASQAYTLPTAASNVLGGVKVGTNLSIDASGVLSATDTNTDALHDLTDVNISLPTNGQVLTYDNVSGKWTNGSAPSTVDELSDLSDVTLTTPTDGQALLYDAANDEWVNGDVAGSAADISYDNTSSGLTADDVQEAIDEIDSNLDTLDGKVYKTDDSTETTIASDDLLPIYDTSATASKKITVENVVKATVSNPNLIDNSWFTVNQRGQNSYSGAVYSVDRWKLNESDSFTMSLTDNGIVLTHPNNNNPNWFVQFFDAEIRGLLQTLYIGKNFTLSIMLADGTIYSDTGVIPTFTSTNQTICRIDIPDTDYYCHVVGRLNQVAFGISSSTANSSISIRAIKFELGSISTLALDTAPNYATELLKCQRYFLRLPNTESTFASIGFGSSYSTTEAEIMIPIPVAMRILPILTSSGGFVIRGGGTGMVVTPTGLYQYSSNSVSIVVTGVNIVNNQAYHMYVDNNANAYIDLSADL